MFELVTINGQEVGCQERVGDPHAGVVVAENEAEVIGRAHMSDTLDEVLLQVGNRQAEVVVAGNEAGVIGRAHIAGSIDTVDSRVGELQVEIMVAGNETSDIRQAHKARTLDELVLQARERQNGLRHDVHPASQIRIEGDRLIAGQQAFPLDGEGLKRLCRVFQVPADYLASLNATLRGHILTEHFAEGRFARSRLTDKASCIVSRDGKFLDLSRSDLFRLDNPSVLQAVREAVGNDASTLEVVSLYLDDELLSVDIVSPRIADEVSPGDIIRAGVRITHSQLDWEATMVTAYVHRLVCTNGMEHKECLSKKRGSTPRTRRLPAASVNAKERQMAQVSRMVAETWKGLQEKLGTIRKLKRKSLPNVQGVIEKYLRQANLYARPLFIQLVEAWEQEGSEPSAYGALNALTRVATHAQGLPGWKRRRLSRLAGLFANQDVHLCDRCYSVLAT